MITEFARAKINLTLDILGKREDNFHEVKMIMQTLELADIVELSKSSGGIIFHVESDENIPTDEKNLAYRAVLELEKFCGEKFDVEINLKKKIPSAAGLAGGSSDAAAVLRGMNKLFDLNFSTDELCEIGEKIGSDIPFCIIGGICLAEGRGEILTKLDEIKKFSVILIKPRGEISTAWSYKTFDEMPEEKVIHPQTEKIIELLNAEKYSDAFQKFSNVLEPVAVQKFPEIEIYKNKMIDAGAEISLMTGSGPTVFALVEEKNSEKVFDSVKNFDAQIFKTKIF
ncbi:MAG: 4-(cytidine 5'-diphospho)-2-C-methyl-D-erythritol kinase [Selenomonadaceae bacterium]|nr:4-(cytidine 5'-diphospho)-2-C-methyl-D-erythritol kinase [Selenomonadaceae bacterium]